jgi:hypothetical protein
MATKRRPRIYHTPNTCKASELVQRRNRDLLAATCLKKNGNDGDCPKYLSWNLKFEGDQNANAEEQQLQKADNPL